MNKDSLVSLKQMMLDIHVITKTLKGMFSTIKYGLENKNCGFGIISSPSAYITHFSFKYYHNTILNEPVLRITSVKSYDDNKNILVNCCNNANTDKYENLT